MGFFVGWSYRLGLCPRGPRDRGLDRGLVMFAGWVSRGRLHVRGRFAG